MPPVPPAPPVSAEKQQSYAMNMLLGEPRRYVVPALELVLLPPLELWSLHHSCVPDVDLVVTNDTCGMEGMEDGVISVDIAPATSTKTTLDLTGTGTGGQEGGEQEEQEEQEEQGHSILRIERTISRIDHASMNLEERTFALELRGLSCNCIRCVHERGAEQVQTEGADKTCNTSSINLNILTRVAAAEGRYEDARKCLHVLMERKPNNGDLLLAWSRLEGWADEWTASRHILMTECVNVCSEHVRVKEKLIEARCYDNSHALISSDGGGSSGSGSGSGSGMHSGSGSGMKFGGKAFVVDNVLTVEECANIVATVEQHQVDNGGWTTSRHYAVPTTDVPVHSVPKVLEIYNQVMKNKIATLLGEQYQVKPSSIRTIDAFVVKYESSKQRSLPSHCDQSEISLTIALNSMDDYEGGGK